MANQPHQENVSPALKGFEKIRRFWDGKLGVVTARIHPGELYVSTSNEMVVTTLGSCVAVCIRDKSLGIGGMNHFMLPEQNEGGGTWRETQFGKATRYGDWAMEVLINEILKAGGAKKNLEFKVFGGGSVLTGVSNIGLKNIEFVKRFLRDEGYVIQAEDVGDYYPRIVRYYTDTGVARIKKLKLYEASDAQLEERSYYRKINGQDKFEGSIDLF